MDLDAATDEELSHELYQRSQRRREEEHRRRVADNQRKILEIRTRRAQQAGMEVEEFLRLADIFDSYSRELEEEVGM
jgi:hypothetical protein